MSGDAHDPPRDAQETIGERLRRLRRERGLTLRELGEGAVSHSYISRLEAGTRAGSVAVLRVLADKLGVSVEYLEHGVDLPSRERVESALDDAELALRLGADGDARAAVERVAAEAARLGDAQLVARATALAGLGAFRDGDLEVAVASLEVALAGSTFDPVVDPDVFVTLGSSYDALGREEDAIALYERCLGAIATHHAAIAAARIRFGTHLSYALTDSGRVLEASKLLRELAAGDVPDDYSRVRIEWARARVELAVGLEAEALARFETVIALLGRTEDDRHRARAELTCADVCAGRGDDERARAYLERGAPALERSDATDRGHLRAVEALLALRRGDRTGASTLVTEALGLLKSSQVGRGVALLVLARIRLAGGDLSAARRAATDGLGLMERTEGLLRAASFAREWADALAAAGHPRSAQTVRVRADALRAEHLVELDAFLAASA